MRRAPRRGAPVDDRADEDARDDARAQGKYCEAGEIASEVVQRSKQLHGDRQPKESLGVMLRLRDLRMHTIPPDAGVRLVHGQSARR